MNKKQTKYSELTTNELRLQVDILSKAFKANTLDMDTQKAYLMAKAEYSKRMQSVMDMEPEQGKLFN